MNMNQPTLKEKLEAIIHLAEESLQELGSPVGKAGKSSASSEATTPASDLVLQIVNKVGDCDEAEAIQTTVLDVRKPEGKLLLPFYIAHKYFENAWLTSRHIESITSGLGVKIAKNNVSNYLVEYKKYLESGSVRKKGQATLYRLNRNGVKRFEQIIGTSS